MYFVAHVCEPMFEDERSERKYMRVTLTESGAEAVRRLHMFKRGALRNSIVEDPLMGRVLTVKIPFRYGRVMCKVEGSKPVQSLAVGDRVEADIEYCGTWNLQGRMKNKTKSRLLLAAVIALVAVVAYHYAYPRVVRVREIQTVPIEIRRPQPPVRTPEFRPAPIKRWKPGIMQQMGILRKGDEVLPLFGKEVRGRRDRYHYYTTTSEAGGSVSLPVSHESRDCMDDIGCQELFSGSVNVEGKDGEYDVKMYRTDDFF